MREIRQKLEALKNLKNRPYLKAINEFIQWKQFTKDVIEAAFGTQSSGLKIFHEATQDVQVFIPTIVSEQEKQRRIFVAELEAYESALQRLITLLKLSLPEEEIKGNYEPGDEYDFFSDLKSLVAVAVSDILIVDPYLNDDLFDLYVRKVPNAAMVRLLSNNIDSNVVTVAKKYANSRPLELRSSKHIHDRLLFIDQRGWVSGQSIKDAAQKKPTYLIELSEPTLTSARDSHNRIWRGAKRII